MISLNPEKTYFKTYDLYLQGKTLECNEKIEFCKYDNDSIQLVFHGAGDFNYHYVAYRLVSDKKYKVSPLNVENAGYIETDVGLMLDKSLATYIWVVDTTVTCRPGKYEFVFICSNTESTDGVFIPEEENETVTFISKPKRFEVHGNFLDIDVDHGAVDVNIKLLYNDVLGLRNNLENKVNELNQQIKELRLVENNLNRTVATALSIANNAYDEVSSARVSSRYNVTFDSLAHRLNNDESVYILEAESVDSTDETEYVVSIDWGRIMNHTPSNISKKIAAFQTYYKDGHFESMETETGYINSDVYMCMNMDLLGAIITTNTKCYLTLTYDALTESKSFELAWAKVNTSVPEGFAGVTNWEFDTKEVIQLFSSNIGANFCTIDITYFIKKFAELYPNEMNQLQLFITTSDEVETDVIVNNAELTIINESEE